MLRRGSVDDPEAVFTNLYIDHHDAVLRYAARRADPDTARDIVAETFLVAWRRLADVPRDARHARPWLYGVARRVLANSERSRRRAETLKVHLGMQTRTAGSQQDPADAITDRIRLGEALQRLSELDREALRLVGFEELDISEAALAMGCSRPAMAVRLHRARRRLVMTLKAAEPDGREVVVTTTAEVGRTT